MKRPGGAAQVSQERHLKRHIKTGEGTVASKNKGKTAKTVVAFVPLSPIFFYIFLHYPPSQLL